MAVTQTSMIKYMWRHQSTNHAIRHALIYGGEARRLVLVRWHGTESTSAASQLVNHGSQRRQPFYALFYALFYTNCIVLLDKNRVIGMETHQASSRLSTDVYLPTAHLETNQPRKLARMYRFVISRCCIEGQFDHPCRYEQRPAENPPVTRSQNRKQL